jgi:hypothetical protein
MVVNLKRVHRVFKSHGLQVRRRPKRCLRTGQSVPMKSGYPNQVWSYDFVHDSCLNGDVVKWPGPRFRSAQNAKVRLKKRLLMACRP